MAREPDPTKDTLFLALTRLASVYGVSVPLEAWMLVVMTAFIAFCLTYQYSLIARAAIIGSFLVAALLGIAALSSWEHNWSRILRGWAETRAEGLVSRFALWFGGTTYRPWPAATTSDPSEMRDYAG